MLVAVRVSWNLTKSSISWNFLDEILTWGQVCIKEKPPYAMREYDHSRTRVFSSLGNELGFKYRWKIHNDPICFVTIKNTLFGTFMLIRLNTSKCPFQVKRNIRGFVDREYDNTQLTIKKPVLIDVENIISMLRTQAIMKPSHENSKTNFFRSQGPSFSPYQPSTGFNFMTYKKE